MFRKINVILVILTFISLLPIFILIVHNMNSLRNRIINESISNTEYYFNIIKDDYEKVITHSMAYLKYASILYQNNNPEQIGESFRHYPLHDVIKSIRVFDANNQLLYSIPKIDDDKSLNAKWYNDVLKTKSQVLSSYYFKEGNKPLMIAALPVLNDSGDVKFVIAAEISILWMLKSAEKHNIIADSRITLIDHDAVILSRYPEVPEHVGLKINIPVIKNAVISGKGGTITAVNSFDKKSLFIITPYSNSKQKLFLCYTVPYEVLFKDLNKTFTKNFVVFGIVSLISIIISVAIGHFFFKKGLQHLISSTNKLSKGDYDFKDNGHNYILDEYKELAESVKNMALKLSSREKTIVSMNTSLFESEERLRSLINAAPDMICLKDDEGRWIEANTAFLTNFGFDSFDYKQRNDREMTLYSRDYKEFYENCGINDEDVVRFKKIYKADKKYILDGNPKWLNIIKIPLEYYGKRKTWVMVYIRDITEIMAAEEKLKTFNEELENKLKSELMKQKEQENLVLQQAKLAAMGEMVGAIAHLWRQPLNTLGLIIQDITDANTFGELDDAYLSEAVESAVLQIDKMSAFIDEFKNFSSLKDNKQPFKIFGLVENILYMYVSNIINKEINVFVRYSAGNHEHVYDRSYIEDCIYIDKPSDSDELFLMQNFYVDGIESELKQVILNIVNNSIEAIMGSRAGLDKYDGLVSFDITFYDKYAEIAVLDNGGGIDSSVIDNIFDPFFSTKGHNTTGIGLYISRNIIENKMDGKITVENAQKGALFRIILPVSKS